jgi:hypothetical protein
MIELYFLIRHTPFWAVPVMVLAGEFGYVFWLKKKKRQTYVCLVFFAISFFTVCFYYWAGGPEKSVRVIKNYYLHNRD